MEILDTSDAIKKLVGYNYYIPKKKESAKDKIVNEPEEQRVSPVKSGRGKGFMCYGDQVVNVPNKLKKDVVPRKTRTLTIAEEIVVGKLANSISIQEPHAQRSRRRQLKINSHIDDDVVDTYAEWGQKLKGLVVEDLAVQSLLDLQKGSKASNLKSLKQKKQAVIGEGSSNAHNKHYANSDTDNDAILYSSCSDTTKESDNKHDDSDNSDMDLSVDNPNGDDDAARFGVFMYNKSTKTPKSTYFSPTVTSSSLDIIQNILNETPANELTNFVSNPVYTDAQTTSAVIYPEGNPMLTSYISGASKVPFGTHVDVQATNVLLQEIFSDENAYHTPSLPARKIPYTGTTPQPSLLQAKAKKLMQKVKRNMRKINFKKVVTQKFKEYNQKLEALTNFNISEAFEKVVQARVLAEIKKLLPTYILKAISNYVRPRLNTSVLDVMKNNQINLFTQSSTSTNDLSELDLKLKLLNLIHLNK
ncbi:hypothetical protein Tco_0820849 [Tanacetum coccineum]|uniref:Uncharacterized protein n=1 Tax=Tanacetum coccineum TaxID=301880 RepID=A0ABQ5AAK5_9ASTR